MTSMPARPQTRSHSEGSPYRSRIWHPSYAREVGPSRSAVAPRRGEPFARSPVTLQIVSSFVSFGGSVTLRRGGVFHVKHDRAAQLRRGERAPSRA